MASRYSEIRPALETYLNETADIPTIAWDNVEYSPTTGTPFIKAQFQPTSRRPSVIGTDPNNRTQGLMTLLLHYPKGTGSKTSQDTCDTLIDRFEAYTDIAYNKTTDTLLTEDGFDLLLESGDNLLLDDILFVRIEYAQQESSYTESPWYVTPITVAWFAYD